MNEIIQAIESLNWIAILKLVPDLAPLEKQEQPQEFHLGDVLLHTRLVVEHLVKSGITDPALLLAGLFHDIGKPAVATMDAKKNRITFYKHMTKSADMAALIFNRLAVPQDVSTLATALIGRHELNYEQNWGDSAVRKLVEECGDFDKLILLRQADLAGQRPGTHVEVELTRLSNLIERVKTLKPVEQKRQKIAVHPFALRHTPQSQFGHFTGSWDELRGLVGKNLPKARKGHVEGCLLVPVPPEGFMTSVVAIEPGMKLTCEFKPRAQGEDAVIETYAIGEKKPAKMVDVILYSHDLLAKDNDASTDAEYEVICINAWPDEVEGPMDPVTMARNALGRKGGTKAEYKAEEILKSVWYWTTHTKVRPA